MGVLIILLFSKFVLFVSIFERTWGDFYVRSGRIMDFQFIPEQRDNSKIWEGNAFSVIDENGIIGRGVVNWIKLK